MIGKRRAGRPRGPDPLSLERGRRFLELIDGYGIPVAAIMEREGMSRTRIYELIKLARAHSSAPNRSAAAQPNGAAP